MLEKLLNLFKSKKLQDDHKLVLSLDGGGVRGLATVIFLKELEKISGKKIFDLFDFFIGTSAGGLSAMHLVINKTSANDLEDFWSQDNLAMSMKGSFWTKNFFLTTKPKYNNESRTELLERYFGNKLISDSEKPIAVLSYDVEDRKPRVLSSYNDKNIRVISAINATSAAPLYYPTVQVEDGSWLIDGGVVANNPCLVGYNEARKYFKTEKYITTVGSKSYIDGNEHFFEKSNIELIYHNYKHPTYNQLFGSFVDYACILDLIFNEGDKSLSVIKSGRRTY